MARTLPSSKRIALPLEESSMTWSLPEVIWAPTRRSSSSRSMAIRPTLRGRENCSRLVRFTVPLAVAKKM